MKSKLCRITPVNFFKVHIQVLVTDSQSKPVYVVFHLHTVSQYTVTIQSFEVQGSISRRQDVVCTPNVSATFLRRLKDGWR